MLLDPDYFRDLAIAFGSFVIAGLGAPLPEEVLIVGAGAWTAKYQANYGVMVWLMLPVCIAGVLIADVFLYTFGRIFGSKLLDYRWIRWMIPASKRERIEKNFHEYGLSILLFGRLLPGFRLPLFLTAGILRLPVPRFVLADALGAVLGNSLLYFLAYWFGVQFRTYLEQVEHKAVENLPIVIMVGIAAFGIYLVIHFLRKPVTEGNPNELPIIGRKIAEHMSTDEKLVRKETEAPPPNGETPNKEEKLQDDKVVRKDTEAPPSANGDTAKNEEKRTSPEQRELQ